MSSADSDERSDNSEEGSADSDDGPADSDDGSADSDQRADDSDDGSAESSDDQGSTGNVIKAIKSIVNERTDAKQRNQAFFSVQDAFLSKDVKVSVNDIGPLNFPIQEEAIKDLIKKSEKAKFGKAQKTVLDTNYRDTQMISADKLKVEINKNVLDNLLKHIGKELNIEQHSKLEIHLYNMLIYGPGQFFKRHRDTEKVRNMIATLVLILPSPHKGGELVIEHNGFKHRFFASPNNEIIKCIVFYPDCYHEVKKVEEGYRVVLTYNVELKSHVVPDARPEFVDENLKDAVNKYFSESENDILVYFLDHEYTENSLKWNMLKGSDQRSANALLAVGKQEGHPPRLALVDYHEQWGEGCEEDVEIDTELYFWVDENNVHIDCPKISISQDEFCFLKDKKKFEPYETEEDVTGNEGTTINEWYHRSAVVLWKDTWAYLEGCRSEYCTLHQLTAQPDKQNELLEKIKDNSERFFSSKFWDDKNINKMVLDIMIYLNDQETTSKILSKLKASEILDLAKNEISSWIASNCSLETWKFVIKKWEATSDSEALLQCLLPFLSNYMTKEEKDLGVARYLLDEVGKFFMKPENKCSANSYSFYYSRHSRQDNSSEKDKQLCMLLQISFQLDNLDLEKALMKTGDSKSSVAHFKMFQEQLHPEQFKRISGDLLSNMTDAALEKIQPEKYIYGAPNQSSVQEVCSLLENCGKLGNTIVEDKIVNHILCNPKTYTASFLADLFIKILKDLKNYVNNFTDLKNRALDMIQAQLGTLKNPNNCSLPISLTCKCDFCKQVQTFLSSATSMQVIIPAAKNNRRHMEDKLRPFVNIFPIKLDTITTGSPHKLSITKLPKLLEDRQNLIKRLTQARNAIIAESSPEKPAAKKMKTQ